MKCLFGHELVTVGENFLYCYNSSVNVVFLWECVGIDENFNFPSIHKKAWIPKENGYKAIAVDKKFLEKNLTPSEKALNMMKNLILKEKMDNYE